MFGFMGVTTEDGNRCMEALSEAYARAQAALKGKPPLYQKYATTLLSVMAALNGLRSMKAQVPMPVEAFNAQACGAYGRYAGTLASAAVEGGAVDQFVVASWPTAPATIVAASVASTTTPVAAGSTSGSEGTFDAAEYEREQALSNEIERVRRSTNPVATATTPGAGTKPSWFTADQISAYVSAIFGGISGFQRAQVEAELLALQQSGRPIQTTPAVEKVIRQRATPWYYWAGIGLGALLLGGVVIAATRKRGGKSGPKDDVFKVSTPPKMLTGPELKLLPAPK